MRKHPADPHPRGGMQTELTQRTLRSAGLSQGLACDLCNFVGRGARDQPGLRALQGAAGEFSTSPAWEPTLPLDRAGGARPAAGYSVKKTRALWLPRPGRLPQNRSADAPLHRQPRRRETQTGMVKPCRVRSGQLRPAQVVPNRCQA